MRIPRIVILSMAAICLASKLGGGRLETPYLLQGTWQIVSIEREGVAGPPPSATYLTFDGGVVSSSGEDGGFSGASEPLSVAMWDSADPHKITVSKEQIDAMARF